jgi:hypothetical protein
MVAMQMGNEDSTNLGKPQMRTAQLHLRAFTTVHKKQFAPDFHDLRRGIVMQSGQSAATPKNMNSEWFQDYLFTDYIKNSS